MGGENLKLIFNTNSRYKFQSNDTYSERNFQRDITK